MSETKEKKLTVDDLENQLKNGKPEINDFKTVFNSLKEEFYILQKQVEYAKTLNSDKEKEFEHLYNDLVGYNAAMLMEKLRGYGYKLRQNRGLREAFEGIGYRILEKARAGKRSEVYHMILRVFIAQETEIPKLLSEPFKPIYSREMFKVFLFSFLGGVLGKEKETDQPD
jgi:hypothetical protein